MAAVDRIGGVTTNDVGCSGCAGGPCTAEPGRHDFPLAGRRLVLASVGLFVGPSVLAIAGAAWYRGSGAAQLGGALGGLVVGMAVAVVGARRWCRMDRTESAKTSG